MSDATAALLQFEFRIRGAEDRKALRFVAVNELAGVVDADQVMLLTGYDQRHFRIMAVSGVSKVDRTAPLIQFLESHIRRQFIVTQESTVQVGGTADWADSSVPPFFAWVPLHQPGPRGRPEGGMLLLRYRAFSDREKALLAHVSQVVAHGIAALRGRTYQYKVPIRRKLALTGFLSAVAVAIMGVIPVQLSTVAPAQIVASQPQVIAAPLGGVIDQILVQPGEQVFAGTPVVRYRSDELEAEVRLAENRVQLASAAFDQASNTGFIDAKVRADLARLQADIDLAQSQAELARERLELAVIVAERDGLAVIDRPEEWTGRPVQPGQRIMQVVDPARVKISVDLAAENVIPLTPGDEVRLALNDSPLTSLIARIDYIEFEPQVTEAGVLSYRVVASIEGNQSQPAFGARGSARLLGQETNLLYQILRRPLVAIRQSLGG